LHKQMMLRVPQAADPDWFLCYLRDYIFSDPGLVVALLQEPQDTRTSFRCSSSAFMTGFGRYCASLPRTHENIRSTRLRNLHAGGVGLNYTRDSISARPMQWPLVN